jgi:hypothetical protein
MPDAPKLLIVTGLAIAAVGVLWWLASRTGFRGLPGDVSYQGEHVKVYFPIVTCIVLSLAATLVMWLIRWLRGE